MKRHNTAAIGGADTEAVAMLDPDVRFLLANERTLLAWVRTGLALIGGGLVLTQFGSGAVSQDGLGIVTILLGAMMSLVGYVRYRAADRAIRASRLPSTGHGTTVQVVIVVGFALTVVGIQLVRMW